jgi:glycosyltransferase involved in cell wall biosynthesis
LGLIGSLIHGHKGVGVALKALAHVRDEIPEIQLKILGNGDPTPWRRLASRLGVEDITRFCGTIPSGEHVLRWLDDIDLYIQPSLTEGLPRAVIEAMSRGCPVLASSAGGTSELLDDDALHRPGDVDRFSDQITSLLRYVPRQTEMARDNFEMSRRYSTDVLSAKRRAFWSAFGAYAAMMKDGSNKLLWQENEGR